MYEEISYEDEPLQRRADPVDRSSSRGGMPVPELRREHGMSSATFYKWAAKFGGMDGSMIS